MSRGPGLHLYITAVRWEVKPLHCVVYRAALPVCGQSTASDHRAGSPGSDCKEPEAPAAAWGRASAVTPPCGHLCCCRQDTQRAYSFHKNPLKNTWSEKFTGKKQRDCTCRRMVSLLHQKPAAALWPDWPVPAGETSPLHAGHAPGWRSHTAPPPEEPNAPHNVSRTAPSPPDADQRPLQERKIFMSTSSNQKQDGWSGKVFESLLPC